MPDKDSTDNEIQTSQSLPTIDSIKYIPVSNFFERIFHENECSEYMDVALKSLKRYSNKLSVIERYDVYYAELLHQTSIDSIDKHFCRELLKYTGFLILYDKEINFAYVILVGYNFFIDGTATLSFSVNENNQIVLIESMEFESEDDMGNPIAEESITGKYVISVSKGGEIYVSEKN